MKQCLSDDRLDIKIVATDENEFSPISRYADFFELIPTADSETSESAILNIAKKHKVKGIFAASNYDLPLLLQISPKLRRMGVRVLVPSQETLKIYLDKRETARFLKAQGVSTPELLDPALILKKNAGGTSKPQFPVVVKPFGGQGTTHTHIVANSDELRARMLTRPNSIVQEYIQGEHYTIDFFNDEKGYPVCIVPRARIRVVGSSSIVSRIDMNGAIIELVRKIATRLADPGLMNIQLIRDNQGFLFVHDINPRLAGGVIVSMKAGAPFARWIAEILTDRVSGVKYEILDGLTMSRFFSEIFWKSHSR